MTLSLAETLRQHSTALQVALNLDQSTARIEVQCLLQAVLGVNRAYLLTYPERILNDAEQARYVALLARRLRGEPIAYLLGEREFFGLTFKVTPDTLIPRPDTELLVELALQKIPSPALSASFSGLRERGGSFSVLDMGTGSGAIALSIAHRRPDIAVIAVDASMAALDVAVENAQRLGIANVHFRHSDWFSALADERYDLIASNPPYIEVNDVHLGQGDVRFEPPGALASGADGLDDIRRICAEARAHLHPGGWLMFEHGYDQAARVQALLQQAGFSGIVSERDLAGIERVTLGHA